jgi:uncharacterized protein (DUF1499 family)
MLKTILWSAAALVCAALVGLALIGRERSWALIAGSPDRGQYDFDAGRRSPTDNDALVCSPGLCANADFEIGPLDEAPAAAIERLAQALSASDPLARRVDDRSDPMKARFVTYSPMFRFPDVIHLEARILPDGRTGLMAYSAAQLGKEDMGKNRQRLEALLQAG